LKIQFVKELILQCLKEKKEEKNGFVFVVNLKDIKMINDNLGDRMK